MTRLSFELTIEDYLSLKDLYGRFISKIQPLGKIIDGETREIIEGINEIYYKLEDQLHEEVVLPDCFTSSCMSGNCTSDITTCRYVRELMNDQKCIRVHRDSVGKYINLGWRVVANDVREEDEMFAKSSYVILAPES